MDKTVGIVGLGIMGGAIARNLVDRGWRVIGFDIDAARRAELALANVTIAGDVAQVARDAPIIMTSLPSPAAVEDVAQEIANSGQPPRIVVELSTLSHRRQASLRSDPEEGRPHCAGLSAERNRRAGKESRSGGLCQRR